jgi:hypothetical protein
MSDVGVANENNGLDGGGDGQGPSVLLASSVGGGVVGEECWASWREEEVKVGEGRC